MVAGSVVSQSRTPKKYARYDLAAIKRAVEEGRVFWQDSVNDDLDKWGYEPEEVLDCILALEPGHFKKTLEYDGNADSRGCGFFDAYVLPWVHVDAHGVRHPEKLYIKLKYMPNGHAVFVLSFHPTSPH